MNFILQWNVGGLISHLPEFKQHLMKSRPLIAAIQETHFRNTDVYNYNVPGYSLYRQDINLPNRQGGVALYVTNSLPQHETVIRSPLNVVAVTVRLFEKDVLFLSLYLPPNSPVVTQSALANLFSQMPENCVVLGDFNAHNPIWGSLRLTRRGSEIETEINKNDLIYMNDGTPTFFSLAHRTTSAIDLSLASPRLAAMFHWTVSSDPLFSDHFPVHIMISRLSPLAPPPLLQKWHTDKANWPAYNQRVTELAPYDLSRTIPEMLDAVSTAAADTIKRASTTRKRDQPQSAPWWNSLCQKAKAIRRRAFRAFQRCICTRHAELYSKARQECAETLRREKQASWKDYATTFNRFTPLGEIWGKVKAFSSRRNVVHPFPQLMVNNVVVSNYAEVTNTFAQHFSDNSSSAIYSPNVHRALTHKIKDIDSSSDNSECYNALFTMQELRLALSKSEEKSSMGPDGLPYSFFTNLDELNLSTFLIAINNLWTNGSFPASWLESVIIPIVKPGKEKSNVNSYRPISLTNCACKIVERMINTRLLYFLESENLIDPSQSGFRGGHSTTDNVVRLISDIQAGWADRRSTAAIFLDLTSAFNKVHNATIVYKLHSLGIRGRMAYFLRNFLQPRSFRVRCQSTFSDPMMLEHGVPQGSVLSPTLFLISINDMFRSFPWDTLEAINMQASIHYSLFADDVAIWCSHRNYQHSFTLLQKLLDHCVAWCEKWGFFLSAPKSAMVVFKRGPSPDATNGPQIGNVPIPLRRTHKFLGITLDSHLTFKAHIEDVRTRCLKRVNILRCLSGYAWGADRKTLTTLYVGIIRSILEYNCFLLSPLSLTLGKRLETIQSTCLRLITGAFRTTPVLALRGDANMPALSDRRRFLLLRYYLKSKSRPNHPATSALEVNRPGTHRPMRRPKVLADAAKEAWLALDLPCVQITHKPPMTPFWLYNDPSILYLFSDKKSNLSFTEIQTAFHEFRSKNSNSVFYFTDGSAHDNKIGSAAIGPDFRFYCRLPDHTTVFSAEVYAIKRVLMHVKDNHIPMSTICTDSKSALQALRRTDDLSHPGVFSVHQLILSLTEDQHVTLLWIPGHCGIHGNDIADTLAKKGALLPNTTPEPLSLSDMFHLLNVRYAEYLQRTWEESHSNHIYTIKPKLGMWNTSSQRSREREVLLARLRCGHTRLTHSHLFTRSDPPLCQSCNVRMSVEHLLIGCQALTPNRRHINAHLNARQLRPTLRTLLGDDPTITDLVLDFVLQSPIAGKL